eukprot:g63753.t1
MGLDGNKKQKLAIFKTITWRMWATLSTGVITYAFTHDVATSGGIVAANFVINAAAYYVHEKAWEDVPG